MINATDALRIVLDATEPLATEKIRVDKALGRVLGEDIVSREDVPSFDNSSMDGYAVRLADLVKSGKGNAVVLKVAGEARAGRVFPGNLQPGNCIRIMTGGKIPAGAGAVVPLEAVEVLKDGRVQFRETIKAGWNIRRAGEDIAKGETVLHAGDLVRPPHLGVLASLGRTRIRVHRRPRVNILATGDELVGIDRKPDEGQIRNSTSLALSGFVQEAGGTPKSLDVARDKRKKIRSRIEEGLKCDVLLITGGVSVGKYDYVKEALEQLGVEIRFWKVNIKPGRPLLFGLQPRRGKRNGTLVFGLPGNPSSTGVTFLQFVRPALLKMCGRRDAGVLQLSARIEHDFSKSDGKRHYLRGIATEADGELHVRTTGVQSSGMMSSLAKANCLIIIPEERMNVKSGELVQVEMLI